MNRIKSSSYLHQFSWEEWDNQIIFVLYRSNRRFVVKRYIERVFVNSSQWQKLSCLSFSNIEPIIQAYTMTENEIKLIHHIFSWHLNGTLTFPIIAGLDQLLDWEDVLDFIERAQIFLENNEQHDLSKITSSSIIPTIPIGISSSSISIKKLTEKSKNSNKKSIDNKIQQEQLYDENILSSSLNNWIQINNICVPYIIKSQAHLIPYQILLDCDLLNEQEQLFLHHLTIKSNSHDVKIFQKIISSSSSINFKFNNDLLLIDLYHLIFGMSKIVYIKLLNNQQNVNKGYKTVLSQSGGILIFHSHSIPFISLGKSNYILFDLFTSILQPSTKTIANLRQHVLFGQSHEIDYLYLVQFYQRKYHQNDNILLNQQQQLLISINDIQKYVKENNIVIDMLLKQYQQIEHEKLKKTIRNKNKSISRQNIKEVYQPLNFEIEQ